MKKMLSILLALALMLGAAALAEGNVTIAVQGMNEPPLCRALCRICRASLKNTAIVCKMVLSYSKSIILYWAIFRHWGLTAAKCSIRNTIGLF